MPSPITNQPLPLPRKSDQEYLQEWDETPLFMNALPTDLSTNPSLLGLQSLLYDSSPLETAQNFKQQGNEAYLSKRFNDAVTFYTKSLESVSEDTQFDSIVLTNRAAVYYMQKRFSLCIKDCSDAFALDATNIKSLRRKASALESVGRVQEAIESYKQCIDLAPTDASFRAHLERLTSLLSTQTLAIQAKLEAGVASLNQESLLLRSIDLRGITHRTTHTLTEYDPTTLFNPSIHSPFPSITNSSSGTHRVTLDPESCSLSWPLFLHIPQHTLTEFLESVDEDTLFTEILSLMFSPPADWDGSYTPLTLRVMFFYKRQSNVECVDVTELTLGQALQRKEYTLSNGVPSFVILPKISAFTDDLLQRVPKELVQ